MNERLDELLNLHALGSLTPDELAELDRLSTSGGSEVIDKLIELHSAAAILAELEPLSPEPAVRSALFADMDEQAHGDFTIVRKDEGKWRPFAAPGTWTRTLSADAGRVTFLLRLDPAARIPHHGHSGPEDCYVVAGDLEIDGTSYSVGDFLHAAAGSGHGRIFSHGGCTLLLTVAEKDYAL